MDSASLNSPNLRFISTNNHWNIDNTGGDLSFFTETEYGVGSATQMTLLSSGNLGIGTTAPAYKLDVNGGVRSTSSVLTPTTAPTLTKGAIYFDSTSNTFKVSQNGTSWVDLSTGVASVSAPELITSGIANEQNVAFSFGFSSFSAGAKSNIILGENAYNSLSDGVRNVAIGTNALKSVGVMQSSYNATVIDSNYPSSSSDNIAIGYNTLSSIISGGSNIAIGTNSLSSLTPTNVANVMNESNNIAIGSNALRKITTGPSNVAIGSFAAGKITSSSTRNVAIGHSAMESSPNNVTSNTAIGYRACNSNYGSYNVCIGANSGASAINNNDGSLYIDVIGGTAPLIGGKFGSNLSSSPSQSDSTRYVFIPSKLTIGANTYPVSPFSFSVTGQSYFSSNVSIGSTATPTYTLQVNGTAGGTTWNTTSDARLKKNVKNIDNALEKILSLRGVSYYWDKKVNPQMKLDNKKHLGFLAQEVEKVLPQVVNTSNDKMKTKAIAYSDIIPVLVEAIKTQQKQIEMLQGKTPKDEKLQELNHDNDSNMFIIKILVGLLFVFVFIICTLMFVLFFQMKKIKKLIKN